MDTIRDIRMLKRFFSYATYNGIAALIGFLSVPYLTRSIPAESYGYIGLLQSLLFFIVPSLTFSTLGLVAINRIDRNEQEYREFVSQYISLGFVGFLLLFPAVLLLSGFMTPEIHLWVYLSIPFICFFQSMGKAHTSELIQDKRVNVFGVYRLISSSLLFLLTVFSISLLDLDWEGRILAIFMTEVALMFLRYFWTFSSLRAFKFILSREFLVEIFRYGWPLSVLLVASWAINEADRFIVLGMLSLSDVGLYTVAYSIGSALSVLNTSMTNAIIPKVYRVMKEGVGKKHLVRLSRVAASLVLCLSILLAAGIYFFGAALVGSDYQGAVIISSIVTVAFGVNGMYRTISLPLVYQKLNKLKARNIYMAAIVNIVTSILLVDHVGVLGPAYGTLISFVFLYVLTLYYFSKHTKHIEP